MAAERNSRDGGDLDEKNEQSKLEKGDHEARCKVERRAEESKGEGQMTPGYDLVPVPTQRNRRTFSALL